MKKIISCCALLLVLLAVGFSGVARAADGELDTSFNGTGVVLTNFSLRPPPSDISIDEAHAVVVDKHGRIVVVGVSNGASVVAPGHFDFAIARYNANGSLDGSFGNGGKVMTDFGGIVADDYPRAVARAVAIDGTGRIVVAGYSHDANGIYNFALARYNDNGSLDSDFGVGGKVLTDPAGSGLGSHAFGVAIDSNGKIVAVGDSTDASGNTHFGLARYNQDGSLDSTFGGSGKVTTDIGNVVNGNSGSSDYALGVALDSSGGIIVAGSSNANDASDFALARYNDNGSLDTNFGRGGWGIVLTGFFFPNSLGYENANAVAIDKDGKIVVVGRADGNLAIARYGPDGRLDQSFGAMNSFGTLGTQITDFGTSNAIAYAVALDSQGRIVVAGDSGDPSFDFAVARYTPTGSLDSHFGSGGLVTTNIGAMADYARGVAVDSQDRIVVAGTSYDPSDNNLGDFALVRYNTLSADLSIAKTASPNPVVAGNTITYTIVVSNAGPDGATNAVVTDNLPSALSFVSCAATGGGVCGGAGNSVSVSFPTLLVGGSEVITIVARVKTGTADGTAVVNSANVVSDESDPNANNNNTSATINVLGPTVQISPASIDFGTVYRLHPASRTVTLRNTASSTLKIDKIYLTFGPNTNWYDFLILSGCGSTLAPGKSCVIYVFYAAVDLGTHTARLNIADNAPGSPQTVSLTGTAIKANH
jgi:uncharacterized delta-60 repeat protein/uncharacterized repeat protein (TIGR01451 family)